MSTHISPRGVISVKNFKKSFRNTKLQSAFDEFMSLCEGRPKTSLLSDRYPVSLYETDSDFFMTSQKEVIKTNEKRPIHTASVQFTRNSLIAKTDKKKPALIIKRNFLKPLNKTTKKSPKNN